MAKISVIYHHFPHYRAPVMRAMASSLRHTYSFYGSHDDYCGIVAFEGDDKVNINKIEFSHRDDGTRMKIRGYEEAISSKFDGVIILGNPNLSGTWSAARKAKRNGLKVAFWTHGWLKREPLIKSKIRNYYYNLSNQVLVYGNRAKEIGAMSGFDRNKISVIYNSLDWEKQSNYYNNNCSTNIKDLRQSLCLSCDHFILTTVSRVTSICHYEWLLSAVDLLKDSGLPITVVMIGEGADLEKLKLQANALNINLISTGAIYDEEILAKYIMASDAIVSPGKVGLTAMHALSYGTPIITHSALDYQMPEVEAVEDGKSGYLFEFGNIVSLSAAIRTALESKIDIHTRRQVCRSSIIGRFTPQDQCSLIDDAMDIMIHNE